MSSTPAGRSSFDRDAFTKGLQLLTACINQSPTFKNVPRPIEMVASGGFVSVMYLNNRSSSQDLDYFLNSAALGNKYEAIRQEMKRLIDVAARNLKYDSKWANDDVRFFLTLLNKPETLFLQSKNQNIVLYRDSTLVIYAVQWEWALCRKMKRLQMAGQVPRREDWSDCVAITKLLFDKKGSALSPKLFQQFDHTTREPPVYPNTVLSLKQYVLTAYQKDVLPAIGWVFFTSRRSFEYKWYDTTPVDQSLWPQKKGIVTVMCPEEKQFNKYNFDKKVWEIPQTSEPTKNNDGDDDEEEEDDVEEEDDEEEEDGSDDESDEETEESGKR